MEKTVFEFDNYRDYLKHALPVSGPGRGSRSRLAEALGCQNGFVSLVLSGAAHFSLEHAAIISRFLRHEADEQDFFLLLVHRERAGSKELETYYLERIKQILEKRREIKARIKEKSSLSDKDRQTYYSSWHYTAVHMCLLVPGIRTKEKISHFLNVRTQTVSEILGFLVYVGLAVQKGDQFVSGPTRMHLPADSPLISKHHSNWRMRAIESLDHSSRQHLHYSSVMSLSHDAAEKIRSLLLQAIQECEPVIRDAKEETVFALAIDLFGLASED